MGNALRSELVARARRENFPVAMGVLPPAIRKDLMALYGFARVVDHAGDEAEGDRMALLDQLEAEVTLAEAGAAKHPAVVPIQPLLSRPGFDAGLLRKLIQANRQDQAVHRYRTFDDLLAYCDLSANPLGRLVLALFGASRPADQAVKQAVKQDAGPVSSGIAGRSGFAGGSGIEPAGGLLAASDAVCSALQVIEHLQDVREDYLNGRIYLPRDDMDRFGCTETDLAAGKAGMALRAVVCVEARRARVMLKRGEPLVRALPGWGRLAVAGFVAGGEAALDAIEAAGHDVLSGDCRPGRARVARHVGRLLLGSLREAGPASRLGSRSRPRTVVSTGGGASRT